MMLQHLHIVERTQGIRSHVMQAEQDMSTAQRDGLAVLLQSTPDDVRSDPAVRWALAVVQAINQNNLCQFDSLLQVATYVQACFLHMLFLEVRTPRRSLAYRCSL
jgi:hypothetical protein